MNIKELKQESKKISKEISGLQSRQDALQKRIEEVEKEPVLECPVKDGDSVFFFDTDSYDMIGERIFDECESVIDALKYNMWWRTEEEARKWVKVHRALLDFQAELGPCDWDKTNCKSTIYYDHGNVKVCFGHDGFTQNDRLYFNCMGDVLSNKIRSMIASNYFTEEELEYYITYSPPRPRRVK